MAKRSKQADASKRTAKTDPRPQTEAQTDPRLDDVAAQLAKAVERITALEEHLKGTPIPWVEPETDDVQTKALDEPDTQTSGPSDPA